MQSDANDVGRLRRAKRVIARALSPAEVRSLPRPPDDLPEAVMPAEEVAAINEPVAVDPTQYGQRKRKRSHQLVYRLTQMGVAASMGATIAGVICLVLDDPDAARLLAGSAIMV